MSEHSAEQGERRKFFRIDDDVYLDFRILSEEAYREQLARPEPQQESGNVGLQLQALTAQMGSILAQIRKRDAEVGQYLSLLDRKIELIGRALIGTQTGDELTPNMHVNLSGGGIILPSTTILPPETKLELKLLLFPTYIFIHCLGSVGYCVRQEQDAVHPFRIGVEFTRISELARDALVRHTLELQSAQLRRSKT